MALTRLVENPHVPVDTGIAVLEATLSVPSPASALVLFAHGSGSNRHSPRNRQVARALNDVGIATLLLDLLTAEETHVDLASAHLRFDIALLARRLAGAAHWVHRQPPLHGLPMGLYGASTGGGVALLAAAHLPGIVHAVVSRGGRTDLAGEALTRVSTPTLLIVGERDPLVLQINEEALAQLPAGACLEIIPGASHLFEEPGTLEQVVDLTSEWFRHYLR